MSNPPTQDQFRGLLIGLAVGDAVGAPVEKASLKETRAYIEDRVRPQEFDGVIRSTFESLPFGCYTDDTQMARELMRSLVDSGGTFDPENYAAKIARLFDEDLIVGSGGTTRRAVQRLIDGTPWDEAGEGSSAGNGACMRVAPLATIIYFTEMGTAAIDQARITHTHPEAIASSIFVAHMVHRILYNSFGMTPLEVVRSQAEYLESGITGISEDLTLACRKLGAILRFVTTLTELGATKEDILQCVLACQDETNWEGISPYALTSSVWAAYAFVTSPDDYWKTIETALWCGGDVDTIAAMAGAMSGARNGLEGIPHTVRCRLADAKTVFIYEDLVNLADQLYRTMRFR